MEIHKVEWTKEKIKNFWETYQTYPEFIKSKFLPQEFYINLLRIVKKFIKNKGKVLDVGCGTATLLNLLVNMGYEAYGIDISEKNITELERKFPKIEFKKGSITDIHFDDEYFDYIFATEVLEHILEQDLTNGLKEIRRVLKPNGKFIITVPYREELQEIICPDCGAVFVPSQHLRSFDENSMKALLEKVGFKLLYCKLVPKLPTAKSFLKKIIMRILYTVSKKAVMFMYGSIFVTVAEKK